MKKFLYLRGNPGTGKITVARALHALIGWKIFWFHDLKNAVFAIVQEHRIPRLMDAITVPVIQHLLEKGENIVYVRPSPDRETVENIRKTVAAYPEYAFHVVRLTADVETLHTRVTQREDPFRICTKEDLDAYLAERQVADIDDEHIVKTDGISPEDVAKEILSRIGDI